MYLDTVSTKALGSDIEYPLRSNALSAKSVLGGRVALTSVNITGIAGGGARVGVEVLGGIRAVSI